MKSAQVQDAHRNEVRAAYAQVAQASDADQATGIEESCCGVGDNQAINTLISTRLGYSETDLENVPSGADMGLGCGNPKAIAALKPGEVVVDLGAGGGFDCFLATHKKHLAATLTYPQFFLQNIIKLGKTRMTLNKLITTKTEKNHACHQKPNLKAV